MNIGSGTQLRVDLREQGVNTQYNLSFLPPSEDDLTENDIARLRAILRHPESIGISVHASNLDMNRMNGSLFRTLHNKSIVSKKHRILDLDQATTFLNTHKMDYRAYHATFDDWQVTISFLMEVIQGQIRCWMINSNVWSYKNFQHPCVIDDDKNVDFLNPKIAAQIRLVVAKVTQILGNDAHIIMEGNITNDRHQNGTGVMITDIYEGYPNPEGIIPDHDGVARLYNQLRTDHAHSSPQNL